MNEIKIQRGQNVKAKKKGGNERRKKKEKSNEVKRKTLTGLKKEKCSRNK